MAGSFYEFPNNVVGGASIPILQIPTPLAALTASVGGPNIAVSLRATIGWQAQSVGTSVTNVLFRIWRGAPGIGTVVVSALDSAESSFDRNKVTTFAGVDFNFTGAQNVAYVLTAELTGPGTAARVIGPLTFTTSLNDITADNRSFFFNTLPNNTAGSILIPVTTPQVPLTEVFSNIQANDTVVVRATIGWQALTSVPNVLFRIWRGAPFTGTLVVSALDSGEASFDKFRVTSFSGVDTGFTSAQSTLYFLTAEVINGNSMQVIGPLTMTVSRYPAGGSTATAFYSLPNNTANSVLIPLTATPQPLALLNLTVPANTPIALRGTVGWVDPGSTTDVIFKIWRGAPITGQLLMSADDSGDVDRFNVTEFAQVDTVASTQSVTYVLTAETTNPNPSTNVIGPITFTAIQL